MSVSQDMGGPGGVFSGSELDRVVAKTFVDGFDA